MVRKTLDKMANGAGGEPESTTYMTDTKDLHQILLGDQRRFQETCMVQKPNNFLRRHQHLNSNLYQNQLI